MAFDVEITNAWVGVRFFVQISGVDAIFLDGEHPVGPAGAVWTAPASKGFDYTFKHHTLDLTGGLSDIGQDIIRRTGTTSPGQMTLTLGPDRRDDYLLDLFARDKPDGLTAVLDESLGYDTGPEVNQILATQGLGGWSAPTFLHLGRETIHAPTINGDDFGQAGNACTRDVFSVGDGDVRFVLNSEKSEAPRVVTNYITVWHNRTVQLFAFLVDREGRALDAAIFGDHCRELFRGSIQGSPAVDDTWSRWSLNCRSIDGLLHSDCGREPIEGRFLESVGDNIDANGKNNDITGKYDTLKVLFLSEGTNKITVTVSNLVAGGTDINTFEDVVLLPAGQPYHFSAIKEAFATTLTDTVQAFVGAGALTPFAHLRFVLGIATGDNAKGRFKIVITLDDDPLAGPYFDASDHPLAVTLHLDEKDSIGKLLGITGVKHEANLQTLRRFFSDEVTRIAMILGPTETQIPFFYAANTQVTDEPAEPGYCKIGGEILRYETITDKSAIMDGLFTIDDCTRGQFGSIAQTFTIAYDETGQPQGDSPTELQFITAFADQDLFDIVLRLATSTGETDHHGVYDKEQFSIGPAIPSQHFDLDAIEAAKVDLMPWEYDNITWWFDSPEKLVDIISKWLQPMGKFLTAKTNAAGNYLITIADTLPALEAEPVHAFTADNILVDEPIRWRSGSDLIVNELRVKWRYDIVEGAMDDHRIVARSLDSQADYGVKGRMDWELRGFDWGSYQIAVEHVWQWAWSAFRRYGRPYDLIELEVDRKGWLVATGDNVIVTIPAVPTTAGEYGFEERVARVLGVTYRYHVPGGVPGAKLLLALEHMVRHSSYSPSAQVSAVAGTTVTFSTNQFTPNSTKDVAHFDAGDQVVFFHRADATVTDVRTIVSVDVDASQVVINTGLVNVLFVADETFMIPSDYDDAGTAATQLKHAFMAALASATADNGAFRYV